MNSSLLAAGILSFVVGAVHSILGEIMIFARMRDGSIVPTHGEPRLQERNVRILWASWHVLTVFGAALGAILIETASSAALVDARKNVLTVIAVSMFLGSLLVLAGTKGRHPGWLGLLAVAVLVWIA